MTRPTFITLILLYLSITHLVSSRIISLTSDGAEKSYSASRFTFLKPNLTTTTVTCEPVYGFLPCTTDLWGQLFLIVVYEYLISLGNKYVSDGSELFFSMIGPGIFGASLFHILGTIPTVVLMLVSGLQASTSSVLEQAEMGMGFLAESAVMLLTLVWGSCIAFGSTEFSRTYSSDHQNQKPFSFTGFGVSTDAETSYTARIVLLSMVPFLILQLAKILNSSVGARVTVLVSLLVTIVFLFAYCFYQVFQPWIQTRRFEYLMHKYVDNKLLRLFITNGNPNVTFMKELFREVDKNKNAYLSLAELRVLFLGIQLEEEEEPFGPNARDFVDKVMEAFDTSGDDGIDEAEFVNGMVKYISDAVQSSKSDQKPTGFNIFDRNGKACTGHQTGLSIWDAGRIPAKAMRHMRHRKRDRLELEVKTSSSTSPLVHHHSRGGGVGGDSPEYSKPFGRLKFIFCTHAADLVSGPNGVRNAIYGWTFHVRG